MPQHQHSEAFEFLEKLQPGGPWSLTAIVPDGHATGILLEGSDETRRKELEQYLKRNSGAGVYYSLNRANEERPAKASQRRAQAK